MDSINERMSMKVLINLLATQQAPEAKVFRLSIQ